MKTRGRLLSLFTAGLGVSGTLLAVPAAVGATPAGQTTVASARVAPGVTYAMRTWRTSSGHRERSGLLWVDLSDRHVHLNGYVVNNVLASGYLPTASMLSRSGGVAAINASFFNLKDHSLPPSGGVVVAGNIAKSPHYLSRNNLFVRTDNTAGIGPVTFNGGVRTAVTGQDAAGRPVTNVVERALWSVNTPTDPQHGHLTLITSALERARIHAGCQFAVTAPGRDGTTRITRIGVARAAEGAPDPLLGHLTGGQTAIVGCANFATWFASLHVGQPVRTYGYLTEGTRRGAPIPPAARRIRTLVAGAAQILGASRNVTDIADHNITGINAETFACVSRDTRHLLLGTVDKVYSPSGSLNVPSAGVTMAELRTFARSLGCWSAVALDGGGSTALDYRRTGTRTIVHGNRAEFGKQRALPDGLIVSYR